MKHEETAHQIAVMQWASILAYHWPELNLLFHIPNGGRRNKTEAAILKAMGVKAGVPDLFLPVPRVGYHGLFCEMKSKDGALSDNQKWWRDRLTAQGYSYICPKGSQDAIRLIEFYLKLPKEDGR